jgi:hypothetical protein
VNFIHKNILKIFFARDLLSIEIMLFSLLRVIIQADFESCADILITSYCEPLIDLQTTITSIHDTSGHDTIVNVMSTQLFYLLTLHQVSCVALIENLISTNIIIFVCCLFLGELFLSHSHHSPHTWGTLNYVTGISTATEQSFIMILYTGGPKFAEQLSTHVAVLYLR